MRPAWIRPVLRWLLGLGLVAAGLWGLNLSLYHGWLAGGPPNNYPEWHAHWSEVLFAIATSLLAGGGLVLWLLRPRRRSESGSGRPEEPPEVG